MPRREIARFSVEYLQILDENGNLDAELDPKLDEETATLMYKWMVFAREVDERMIILQRQGRLGTFPPCIGQEAASIGPALAMRRGKDWFIAAFREVAARMYLGEPLHKLLLMYNGWEEGNYSEAGPRLTPIYVPIATQMPHAVGTAYAMRYKGEKDNVSVCFVGDGGTSTGDFHEALNFAATWKVPAVFICQNNQWAISVPLHKQTASQTIAQKGIAYGMHYLQVDGNDGLAMYAATREAIARAQAGDGPTFIEAVTYRLKMHTTADDPTKYRDEEEVKPWLNREPLKRFKIYLEQRGLWDEAKEKAVWDEAKAYTSKEVEAFETASGFKIDAPFDHVFGTRDPYTERQRDEFKAALKQEGIDG
jgi:pyruvate dehydrogenase E1 component alpha subunit